LTNRNKTKQKQQTRQPFEKVGCLNESPPPQGVRREVKNAPVSNGFFNNSTFFGGIFFAIFLKINFVISKIIFSFVQIN
jgi:hypothetical protein